MTVDFGTHILELIQEKHAWRICNFMVSNEDRFKTYLPSTLAQNLTPELSQLFVAQKLKSIQKKEEFVFVLKNIEEKTVDGIFYIKEINWIKKQAELAYVIGYTIEGKGFATKVVAVLSNYAFNELQLDTIQIITHKTNNGSVKVAEKCNFTWIRTLEKSFTPPSSKPLDMELYELQNER